MRLLFNTLWKGGSGVKPWTMDILLGYDIAPLAQLLGPLLEPDPLGSAGRQLLSHRLHPCVANGSSRRELCTAARWPNSGPLDPKMAQ